MTATTALLASLASITVFGRGEGISPFRPLLTTPPMIVAAQISLDMGQSMTY
jgi:hypothetical protein